jgi:hypothetical protein
MWGFTELANGRYSQLSWWAQVILTLGNTSADHGREDGTSAIRGVAVVIRDSGDGDTTKFVRDGSTGLSNKDALMKRFLELATLSINLP